MADWVEGIENYGIFTTVKPVQPQIKRVRAGRYQYCKVQTQRLSLTATVFVLYEKAFEFSIQKTSHNKLNSHKKNGSIM